MLTMVDRYYLITPDFEGDKRSYFHALMSSLKNGIRLVQFRSKDLDTQSYKILAKEMTRLVHQYGGKIILNAPVEMLNDVDADGIHFPSCTLAKQDIRPLSDQTILSVACHNQAQMQIAQKINADIAVLSPIFSTPSSPKGIPMGWEKFSQIVKSVELPVFALGGLTLNDYALARQFGAFGIGAKRALWDLKKPLI